MVVESTMLGRSMGVLPSEGGVGTMVVEDGRMRSLVTVTCGDLFVRVVNGIVGEGWWGFLPKFCSDVHRWLVKKYCNECIKPVGASLVSRIVMAFSSLPSFHPFFLF